jgi:hypothetical protein
VVGRRRRQQGVRGEKPEWPLAHTILPRRPAASHAAVPRFRFGPDDAILTGMADASHSRHNWLVLMTVAGILLIPCCWLVVKWREVRMEREAAVVIRKRGGDVVYKEPRGLAWLCRLFDDECFMPVTSITFGPGSTSTDLRLLESLPHLELLDVGGEDIREELKHLRGLVQLRRLSIRRTEITDTDLGQLRSLSQLRYLDLAINYSIKGPGLRHLKSLTRLEELRLNQTGITDAGLENLKQLTQLRVLDLGWNYDITDAGLERLNELTRLCELNLTCTSVTDAGVKKLQTALPKCRIKR